MTRLRLVVYQMKVKEVTTRILGYIPDEFKDTAEEIVTDAFCDVLGQRLAGPMPSRRAVEINVRFRAFLAKDDPDEYAAIAAAYIHTEVDYLAASLQRQEDVDGYKDACETILNLADTLSGE